MNEPNIDLNDIPMLANINYNANTNEKFII
jgi:hypothetical protein